jgi:hypothetical protein
MMAKNKSVVLVDRYFGANAEWMTKLKNKDQDFVLLDPVNLFSELNWTKFEDDASIFNTVYSRLFEGVVLNNKRLVCFWPLVQQYGNEWFELSELCRDNSYELKLYKSEFIDDKNYGFSEETLRTWKRFIFFLLESLFEEIQLNEHIDEIATLTSEQDTIFLFKLDQEGNIRFSYAFNSEFLELPPVKNQPYAGKVKCLESFETFSEMLEKLLKMNDLSLYEPKFKDGTHEKTYFNILAKEFKTTNLIENWIKTYSLN